MLRITLARQSEEEVELKVEGRLGQENVALLEQEGKRWLEEAGQLVLDLGNLRFIDEEGAVLLRRWSAAGVRWHGGSMFVHELLKSYGLE